MKKNISLLIYVAVFLVGCAKQDELVLLNVSYDPTREMFQAYNSYFSDYWKKLNGSEIRINQSHGGSGKQARAIINGLHADIASLALAYDLDAISEQSGFIDREWIKKFPDKSCPFYSTIVFMVRKGNPKSIKDWDDLARNDVSVVVPNPKISGGARWTYMAIYGAFSKKFEGDFEKIEIELSKVFRNVPVLDSSARASTITFLRRDIGDVLVTWENEALMARKKLQKEEFEIIVPPTSILAEPPVAVVDWGQSDLRLKAAHLYLSQLYSREGQQIIARHFFRPQDQILLNDFKTQFQEVELFSLDSLQTNWSQIHKVHFSDGGVFDHLIEKAHTGKKEDL